MSSFSDFLGLIPAIATAGAIVLSVINGWIATNYSYLIIAALASIGVYAAYWFCARRETFASGWLKNFNDDYSETGFLRIWDFQPNEIGDNMLQDLYDVSIHWSKI